MTIRLGFERATGGPATELADGCTALGSLSVAGALTATGALTAQAGATVNVGGSAVLSVAAGAVTVGAACQLLLPDGTPAAPALAFSGATNGGVYRSGSATPAISSAGALRAYFAPTPIITGETLTSSDFNFQKIAAPANPGANQGRLFLRDNGAGKMQLACIMPTGAVIAIATEV